MKKPSLLTLIIVFLILGGLLMLIQNTGLSKYVLSNSSALKDKKILFLGDSLTSLERIPYEEAIKTPLKPNKKMYFKYIDWVREMTGAECYNFGYSGSSIAVITSPSDPDVSSFISRHKEIIKLYPDPSAFDIIILFGGVNDYMQHAPVSNFDNPDPYSFYGAVNETVKQLNIAYPEAKIVLMNPLLSSDSNGNFDTIPNNHNYLLSNYRKAIEDVSKSKGVFHFKTDELSGLNPNDKANHKKFYLSPGDGVHPNPAGHKKIAISLVKYLESLYEN